MLLMKCSLNRNCIQMEYDEGDINNQNQVVTNEL